MSSKYLKQKNIRAKNVLSVVFGLILLIGSGVLFAFQSSEGETPEKPSKLKITIVKDNNESLQKSEEIIEVKSREDLKTYLKSKDIDLSELFFMKKNHHTMVNLGTEKCGFIIHQENQWVTKVILRKSLK